MLVLIMLGPTACGRAGNGAEPAMQSASTPPPSPLELRFELPAQVRAGEGVLMRMVLLNRGTDTVAVELGGNPTAFDFIVTADGHQVWHRLEGVAIEDILLVRSLAPGDSLEFADTWNQRTDRGGVVEPGTYQVHGTLPAIEPPRGWSTAVRTLTIVR
jgi:hypothetical protein